VNFLEGIWRSVVDDDEHLYPETTGCPELPPAIKDIAYWVMCIAGETAEMLNLIKKRWRNGHWDPKDLEVTKDLVRESVDVLIYLVELYEELGVDEEYLWDAFQDKRYQLHFRWQKLGSRCECDFCVKYREEGRDKYGVFDA